jgi:hypothetical protein
MEAASRLAMGTQGTQLSEAVSSLQEFIMRFTRAP